jgi:hypothetical protein
MSGWTVYNAAKASLCNGTMTTADDFEIALFAPGSNAAAAQLALVSEITRHRSLTPRSRRAGADWSSNSFPKANRLHKASSSVEEEILYCLL